MDAPDADADIKLRKLSADLINDINAAVGRLVRSRRRHNAARIRSRMETAAKTLDLFQELPQLLDPHLSTWIPLLADAYLDCYSSSSPPRPQLLEYALCRILYALCKVRGEKVVIRFLPVDVRCLEVLLGAIEAANDNEWQWEQRYVVLLWLSHLLLAPFDLATISSADVDDDHLAPVAAFVWPSNMPGIAARLIPLAMRYLAVPGKEHDAAKALLVRLALRRDMQQLGLVDALVSWALASLRPSESPPRPTENIWFYLGLLSFLAALLTSAAETSDVDAHLHTIFGAVHRLTLGEDDLSRSLVSLAPARKAILKVMRCVVVSLLRKSAATSTTSSSSSSSTTDVVETTIGHFLESLADNDTPVRLAASKALSLVTLRLAPLMASQVVDAVLDALDRNVLHNNQYRPGVRDLSAVDPLEWHGLMLTLSHLLFRRSPPATRLAPILRALRLGLSFEKRSTAGSSVGANVRDAACFGVWATARRYTSRELLAVPATAAAEADGAASTCSVLQLLATELVLTASLDPAGNIRRGASAALQELIGRHPDTICQGIALVQTVDYHAVARRSRAVADVAVAAARLSPCYADALVDGILGWRGVGDAHAPWRRAAAAVYGLLAAEQSPSSPSSLPSSSSNGEVGLLQASALRLTGLIEALANRQVQELHGLLLCLASVIDQMVPRIGPAHRDAKTTAWMGEMLRSASGLLADCRNDRRNKPELVAEGAARLVVALCPVVQAKTQPHAQLRPGAELLSPSPEGRAQLVSAWNADTPADDADVVGFLSQLRAAIPTWLGYNEPDTIEWASSAALMLLVFSPTEERDKMVRTWADVARRKTAAKRGGYGYFRALGLALVPLAEQQQQQQNQKQEEIICEALLARWEADDDIDTKVALLASLVSSGAMQARPERFLGIVEQGLSDYTTNARGDVGSHVRVGALRALRERPDSVGRLLPRVMSLAAERLDRVRPEAQAALALALEESQASLLVSLDHSSEAYFAMLLRLASARDGWLPATRKWEADEMTAELLAGLVTSADTGNDELVVASRAALGGFCCSGSDDEVLRVCGGLVDNLVRWRGADRVVVPTIGVAAFLLHGGLFRGDTGELCRKTQRASQGSGNVRKLVACARLYGGVVAAAAAGSKGGEKAETAMAAGRRRLGALMAHPWPRVRSAAVDEAWALLAADDVEVEEEESRLLLLLGEDWGAADKERMCGLAEALGLK
ncbi:hypothetical protein CP533_1800 [Ophiocordyceps camponoti-saundersi (nom. inval.)]|nr:hypothetical protein CP533_1800 [Ophiocordyceps camponoti-saundersi (nom. inval.)]